MPIALEANWEPIPGYRLTRYLGRGGFGEVWEAEVPGGLVKAIKLAPMENNELNLNCRELDGLQKVRSIRHPYLLSIERFEVVEAGYLVIVMELADKSLADRLNECRHQGLPGIPRDELLRYMRESAEVLDLMNKSHGLQHMDVKPENLFLCGGHVKVADFGLVQPRNSSLATSAVAVSPPYAPPELFNGQVESTADQYSLAVTFQELLTGKRPYNAPDIRGLMMQHLRDRPDLAPLPPGDRPILARALSRDPSKRFESCLDFVKRLTKAATFAHPGVVLPTKPLPDVEFPLTAKISARPSPVEASFPKGRLDRPPEPEQDEIGRVDTVPISGKQTFSGDGEAPVVPEVVSDKSIRTTFIAYLPLEIYVHKLRGFIDALQAEIITCSDENTVLRFATRGWFGLRSNRGLYLQLDTCAVNPSCGYRVVDVYVWHSSRSLKGRELGRRAMLLVYCLKGFLMATDSSSYRTLKSDAQIRAEILHH